MAQMAGAIWKRNHIHWIKPVKIGFNQACVFNIEYFLMIFLGFQSGIKILS